MKKLFFCFGFFITASAYAQNVGINNPSPIEKLDIIGNIKADTAKLSALVLDNGFIKVTGGNKSAFRHLTAAGNILSNTTNLNYANESPDDLLIVTHQYNNSTSGSLVGNSYNKPFGVWWNGSNWTIYSEDSSIMPEGLAFNVLVIKQ